MFFFKTHDQLYIYIFSQQLYSHACIPSADGPIITMFVVFFVGFFWGWGVHTAECGEALVGYALLNLKFSVYCFFLAIAYLSLFILTIVLYVNPSSNYSCGLTPLVSSNFFSPLFQTRAFPFINTYKRKYKTVHFDKT